MAYLRDTVYVLRSEPYREHDVRITMYGREHGKLEAVARGVRTWKAKQRGHLQPLSKADVMIAKGVAFDRLAVAHAVTAQPDLRRSLGALAIFGSFAGLVERLTRPGVPDPDIFHLLDDLAESWKLASQETSAERARLAYAGASLRLLGLLGYAPDFERRDGLTDETRKLLLLLARMPSVFVLSVTASPRVFSAASAAIEDALERTPLAERPHGPMTIAALLTPLETPRF